MAGLEILERLERSEGVLQSQWSPNRVPKWWRHKNEICEIMGFVKLFWKNNVQDAYSPKISNSGQIVSEILAQLCCDDSIQILLNLAWFIRLGTR